MKKTIITLFVSISVLFSLTSCNDWLDVTPQAQVSADKIFSTPEGYESVLYGIYISMTEGKVYGQHSTYGLMDVLAQYYNVYTNKAHTLYEASLYNYYNGDVRNVIDDIWLNNYNTIANCNILLEYLAKKDPNYFKTNHYNLLKGEALAIRAFLHFDLLRAFALNYQNNPEAMGIPYANSFTQNIHHQLKIKDVTEKIINDLQEARGLLKDIDPVFKDNFKEMIYHFTQPQPENDEFISYRAYRMNYYAVTALLARVYDYYGDKDNAYKYAKEVITAVDNGLFQFTPESSFTAALQDRDLVTQNELLFALNSTDVKLLFYQADANNNNAYILLEKESIYTDPDDFRQYLIGESTSHGKDISYKYLKLTNEDGYVGKIPMLRISEMYFIAALSIFNTNKKEAVGYLETIRKMRGASQVINSESYDQFLQEIMLEAKREFLGEGQLFYWYKRHNLPVKRQGSDIILSPQQMCLPMPANEVEFGNRIEDYIK